MHEQRRDVIRGVRLALVGGEIEVRVLAERDLGDNVGEMTFASRAEERLGDPCLAVGAGDNQRARMHHDLLSAAVDRDHVDRYVDHGIGGNDDEGAVVEKRGVERHKGSAFPRDLSEMGAFCRIVGNGARQTASDDAFG
jgi:hypothetical protein